MQCCIGWVAATLIYCVYCMFISNRSSVIIVKRAGGKYIERILVSHSGW